MQFKNVCYVQTSGIKRLAFINQYLMPTGIKMHVIFILICLESSDLTLSWELELVGELTFVSYCILVALWKRGTFNIGLSLFLGLVGIDI